MSVRELKTLGKLIISIEVLKKVIEIVNEEYPEIMIRAWHEVLK